MNTFASHPAPRLAAVLLEQVRVVGLGLRREAAVLAALLAGLALIMVIDASRGDDAVDFEPVGIVLIAILGLLLPFVIWRGETSGGYFWTQPLDHRRHALAKALAGALWLLVATAAFLLWILALALLTGGEIGVVETRYVLKAQPGADALVSVTWTTPAWEWIAPFTGGLVAYLLGTAFVLGVRHPVRSAAALVVGLAALVVLDDTVFPSSILSPVLQSIAAGPYGVDAALSGGSASLTTETTRPGGKLMVFWLGLPTLERWAGALALWTFAGAAGLWAALLRYRER